MTEDEIAEKAALVIVRARLEKVTAEIIVQRDRLLEVCKYTLRQIDSLPPAVYPKVSRLRYPIEKVINECEAENG